MEIETKTGSGYALATVLEASSVLSASRCQQGWLGGLDVPRELLELHPNSFGDKLKDFMSDLQPQPLDLKCFSISGYGLRQLRFKNLEMYSCQNAFGGDTRTQLIGLTICALGHETPGMFAMRMFLKWMLPHFVGKDTEILHALNLCLLDNERIKKIINEGHARGLNKLFCDIADDCAFPVISSAWMRDHTSTDEDVTDCHFVIGMLKWLMSGSETAYYTRSSVAARMAAYLKGIGYPISTVLYWRGETLPSNAHQRAVILINDQDHNANRNNNDLENGAESADVWATMVDHLIPHSSELNVDHPILHYGFESVGSMLHAALGYCVEGEPEVFQRQFRFIYSYMRSHIKTSYSRVLPFPELRVHFDRVNGRGEHRRVARKLAKIFFPKSAAFFAPCYNEIATEALLDDAKYCMRLAYPWESVPEDVVKFWAVTAAIVIAFLGVVADEDFRKSRHIIKLSLRSPWWLERMCRFVDNARLSSVSYHDLVRALSIIHCAAGNDHVGSNKPFDVIAWRSGCFSVLPNIFFAMNTSISMLDIRLIDEFWANITPDSDGGIRSGFTVTPQGCGNPAFDDLNQPSNTIIARPRPEAPDTRIDLDIERPLHSSLPSLSLVGRVDGKVIGSCGMYDLLCRLIYAGNLEPMFPCPGHRSVTTADQDNAIEHDMLITKTSVWRDLNDNPIPIGDERPTYVPTGGDEHWALFLTGFSNDYNAKIVRGCALCAEMGQVPRSSRLLLIGLGRSGDMQEAGQLEEEWDIIREGEVT